MIKHRAVIFLRSVLIILIVLLAAWWIARTFFSVNVRYEPDQQTAIPEENTLACIDALPDNVKIAQKIMVAGYNDQLGAEVPVLANAKVGGIIMMTAATGAQVDDLVKAMTIAPLIAVDQEGGTIQRYTAEGRFPGAAEMAQGFSVDEAYDKYLADNKYLKSIGITTNFAPVVDVISAPENPLPGRLYSADANVVTDYASASVRAAQDAGITPVIKHFPGLGSATGNTDYGSATTDPFAILQTRDLLPYKQLAAQHPDVMVSNAIVPDLTGGQPAVWSPEAVKLLRDMGYRQAVIYSDSLTAHAVPGTLENAAIKTWQAGVDMALIVQGHPQTPQLSTYLETIIKNASEALQSGVLDRDDFTASVARILEQKGIDACRLNPAAE
jgi:beta-N-acetylhexosaminidase